MVDLLSGKAYEPKGNKAAECAVPGEAADDVEALTAELMEAAAGADEELMEKFFETMELSADEIAKGARAGVREGSVVPVLCGSSMSGLGSIMLLDGIIAMGPTPAEGKPLATEEGEFVVDPNGSPVAFVFKTISDQYGKYSFVKVLAGTITPDLAITNSRTGNHEKLGSSSFRRFRP